MSDQNTPDCLFRKQLYALIGMAVPALLIILLLPSTLTSAGVLLLKYVPHAPPLLLVSAAAYLILMLATLGAVVLLRNRIREGTLVGVVLLASFGAKILVIALHPDFMQSADCLYYRDFVVQMVDQGINKANMADLSGIWDYQLWIGRAFPFMALARRVFGERDLLVAMLINATLITATLACTHLVARRMLGVVPSLLATTLLAFSPIQTWIVLQYSHQPQGAFWIAAVILLGLVITRRVLRRRTAWPHSLLLGAALSFLFLQRGIDLMAWLLLFFLCAMVLCRCRAARRWLRLFAMIILVPLVVYLPSRCAFTAFSEYFNAQKLGSGLIGIIAHGWNHETGGEYYGPYDQIDRVSPVGDKGPAMMRIILSTACHQPWQTAGRLTAVKIGKYFLIGYASGIEQNLADSGYANSVEIFRGMRLVYAPAALALAVWGLLRFLRQRHRGVVVALVAGLPVVGCMLFAILGQTSPRYSYYVQFALAILGGAGWVSLSMKAGRRAGLLPWTVPLRRLVCVGLLFALFYAAGWGAVIAWGRTHAGERLYQDMRTAACTVRIAGQEQTAPMAAQSALACEVNFPAADVRPGDRLDCAVTLDDAHAGNAGLSLFLWASADPAIASNFTCEIAIDGRTSASMSLAEIKPVLRWAYDLEEGMHASEIVVSVVYTGQDPVSTKLLPVGIRWGYLFAVPRGD